MRAIFGRDFGLGGPGSCSLFVGVNMGCKINELRDMRGRYAFFVEPSTLVEVAYHGRIK